MKSWSMYLRSGFFLFLLLAFYLPAFGEGDGLKVTEMAVTTKIVRGKPIDSVRRISSTSVKALYCFTRLKGSGEETVVKHVWYRNNEQVAQDEMPVKGRNWRTYSRKAIDRASAGEWRVEALDSEGNLLKKIEFRIN